LDALQCTELAIAAAQDKKAVDVVLLDLRPLTIVCDYFLICSARNRPHAKAITEGIEERLKEAGRRPDHIEGLAGLNWVLMDYGDVVIHVFQPEERAFYDLERLWADAESKQLEEVVGQARSR
jgi:ribosome-associated protein